MTMQWYNENEGRAYPLSELATLVDINGVTLPNDILVDLCVLVPPIHQNVYVSSIRITPALVSIGISSDVSGLLVGTFTRDSVRPYAAYALTALVDNVSGHVTFGEHRSVITEDYRFASVAASGLATRAVHVVDTLPVNKLLKLYGNPNQSIRGLVRLVAGSGLAITQDPDDSETILITLNADLAQAFASPCTEVANADACGAPPIRRINNICPDENGKIILRFE